MTDAKELSVITMSINAKNPKTPNLYITKKCEKTKHVSGYLSIEN